MLFIKRLYSIWAILIVVFFFFFFLVPLFICIPFKRAHFVALRINYIWAWAFYRLAFLPVETDWRFELERNRQYILCANHFSYLDIPAMGLFPMPFKFVGKSQLAKIPLFGLMYKYLHITVNRASYRDRAKSLSKARAALKDGFNLGMFPEGGIRFAEYPKMNRFQDGAFRLAAEYNISVIPITFPDHYAVFPDDGRFLFTRKKCKVIYHKPIAPNGNSDEDIKQLKTDVYRVIQDELDKHHTIDPSHV